MERRRRHGGREEEGGEVDSDAQLEQGRRLAKAGPEVIAPIARSRRSLRRSHNC